MEQRLDDRGPSACRDPVEHPLPASELSEDVSVLSALGSETRYETLRLIAAAERAVCVCEIEPALDVGQSAVSQALSRLHDAGLLTRRKEGRWRYYATTPTAERLLTALDDRRTSTDE